MINIIINKIYRRFYRLIFDKNYRSYLWLVIKYSRTPRFQERHIRVQRWSLIVPDMASFLSAYKDIFVEEIYAFNSDNQNLSILDCGANIGLSILYFKEKYPLSRIMAFEADPTLFHVLEKNMSNNKMGGVEIINKAVWSSETFVEFSVEGADGGRVNIGNDPHVIKVPAVGLASLIEKEKFEFVKVDIEGAEVEAFKGCDFFPDNIKYIFVEFHSFLNKKQELGRLILTFEQNGFRVHIHPPYTVSRPFLGMKGNNYGMDMQLNLFFWREKFLKK